MLKLPKGSIQYSSDVLKNIRSWWRVSEMNKYFNIFFPISFVWMFDFVVVVLRDNKINRLMDDFYEKVRDSIDISLTFSLQYVMWNILQITTRISLSDIEIIFSIAKDHLFFSVIPVSTFFLSIIMFYFSVSTLDGNISGKIP